MKTDKETELFWEEFRTESFEAIRAVIDRLEEKLKVYSGKEAFEFLKPIRYLICSAEMQLDEERDRRIEDSDLILNQIN